MVAIDARVVLFLLGITVLTAVVFGLMPAMHAAAGNPSDALKEGGRGDSDGIRRNRLRSFLVASEFALAFMLLIGAGLMIRSFLCFAVGGPGIQSAQRALDGGIGRRNERGRTAPARDFLPPTSPEDPGVAGRELCRARSTICRWPAICGDCRSALRAVPSRGRAKSR